MAKKTFFCLKILVTLLSIVKVEGLANYVNNDPSSLDVQVPRLSSSSSSTCLPQRRIQDKPKLTGFDPHAVDRRHEIHLRHSLLARLAVADSLPTGETAHCHLLGRSASASAEPVAQPFALPNALSEAIADAHPMPGMYSTTITQEILVRYAEFIAADERRTERLFKAVNDDDYLKGVVMRYFQSEEHGSLTLRHFHDFIKYIPDNSLLRRKAVLAASSDMRLHNSIIKLMNQGWA